SGPSHVCTNTKEVPMQFTLEECPGCQVAVGMTHDNDCDHARCPDCGEQLFFHDCDHWPEDADGPDRPAMWHGVDPRIEVARARDWWTTISMLTGSEEAEDCTRVLIAEALGQITWNP